MGCPKSLQGRSILTMKKDELIYRVEITAGMMDLAYRSTEIIVSGVENLHNALQTAIAWVESTWYPDWLPVNLSLYDSQSKIFIPILFYPRPSNCTFQLSNPVTFAEKI